MAHFVYCSLILKLQFSATKLLQLTEDKRQFDRNIPRARRRRIGCGNTWRCPAKWWVWGQSSKQRSSLVGWCSVVDVSVASLPPSRRSAGCWPTLERTWIPATV